MPRYITDIVVIAFLLLCNALLAMSEMAIVSARKARLTQLAEEGDRGAKQALDIANSPTQFLSSIQIGITLAAILTGIFGGATIADDLAEAVRREAPHLAPHADTISIAIVTGILTYISLVVGELVPKRLALTFPESIARYSAGPLTVFSRIVRPFVWVLSTSTETILRVVGLKATNEPAFTEAEIHVIVEQATEAGIFEEVEQEMVASVLRLDNKKVSSIMTPRTNIEWLDLRDGEEEWVKTAAEVPHSRLIVADGSLDHVTGIVDTKTIIHRKLLGKIDLKELQRQPMYVPENIVALDLIRKFKESTQEVAVVLDEYGGVSGLVSREDIFEAIVGDLPAEDEHESGPRLHNEPDGSWIVDGQIEIQEFIDKTGIHALPDENEEEDYRTIAGFILNHLERVPERGEQFVWKDVEFKVLEMDHNRIDKIQVRRLKQRSGS
jgi:putative hemolysin